MNGLFRFIAKLIGRGWSGALETPPPQPSPETVELASYAPGLESPLPSPRPPEPSVILLDLGDDEDVSEELDDESDEPDPTLGRYEELHVEILDAEEVDAQRAAAESEGLSGPHKIFPHDPAGPGSLAETLARLEADGRVTSRVCDDADSGFYILYEPASKG
jgi:Fe-S-cluster formation regulator IscX/YfhJ